MDNHNRGCNPPYPASPSGFVHPMPTSTPPPYNIGFSQPAPAPPQVIVVQNPPVGRQPVRITCPHCHANVTTRVEIVPTTKTHLAAFLCWFLPYECFDCCCCCCCLPYCCEDCQAKKHYCSNCNAYIGTYDS